MKRLILASLSVAALSVAGISSVNALGGQTFNAQQQTQNEEQLQACNGDKGNGTNSGQDGQSGSTSQV